jgi:hypothetical protein
MCGGSAFSKVCIYHIYHMPPILSFVFLREGFHPGISEMDLPQPKKVADGPEIPANRR